VTQSSRVALSASLLIVALLFLHFRSAGEAVSIRKPLDSFPMTLGDWQRREATIFELDVLNVLKVKDYVMTRYVNSAGRSLWLFIGYWDTQRKGAQPHSPKNCLPGAGWEPVEASQVTVPLPPPYTPITVNRYLIQKDASQQLVFYWYQSRGEAIMGEVAARVEMVKGAILYNRTDGALIRISSPVYGGVPETTERLVQYVQAMYPVLREYLPD